MCKSCSPLLSRKKWKDEKVLKLFNSSKELKTINYVSCLVLFLVIKGSNQYTQPGCKFDNSARKLSFDCLRSIKQERYKIYGPPTQSREQLKWSRTRWESEQQRHSSHIPPQREKLKSEIFTTNCSQFSVTGLQRRSTHPAANDVGGERSGMSRFETSQTRFLTTL